MAAAAQYTRILSMPNERHLQQIVELLEEESFRYHGRTAERMADGIQRSGINDRQPGDPLAKTEC